MTHDDRDDLLIGLRHQRLRQILWVLIAGFALLAFMNFLEQRWISGSIEALAMAVFGLALQRNAQGQEDQAAWLTLGTLMAILTALMLAGQGLYDEAPMAYPGVLVFASMFGSRRLLNTLTLGMLATLLLTYGLHTSGVLPGTRALDFQRLVVLVIILVVTTLFVAMTSGDMQRLLSRLSQDKQALQRSHARITELAYHDPLTGLANRTLARERLEQQLEQARQGGHMLALLFLDLDNLKTINDSLGHTAGDALLRQVAGRLAHCVGADDTLAHLSGDEFLLLYPRIDDEEVLLRHASSVMQQLTAPFDLQGLSVHASGSLGITLFPRDGKDAGDLLKNADLAMYQAKDAGRNTFRFFDPGMNANVLEHLHLATGLRHALAHGELQLHYQPQWDLHSGRIIGAEALLRWQHAELGWIGPAKFIPIAERAGLIHDLGTWVLRQACADLQRWRSEGLPLLPVAINVSPLQFRRSDMVHEVASTLAAHGLPAHLLELEITESMLVADAQTLEETLQRLHQLGVAIAIDDFGTGYSNLGYLQRYPVQRLKIDQSFVRRLCDSPQAEGLVRAIIEMAHCLGLQTLAEGVENAPTLARLQAFGCEYGQGFHWSPAIPAADFTALVRNPPPAAPA